MNSQGHKDNILSKILQALQLVVMKKTELNIGFSYFVG